jgi:adenine deaminase
MDRVLRHAISQGLPPMTAIQMATVNTAEHFGLSRELGMIAPRRWADILLVDDLNSFHTEMVIARGQVVAQNGQLVVDLPKFEYPDWAVNSVHLARKLTAADFRLGVDSKYSSAKKVMVNVIGIIENQAPNRHLRLEAPVNDATVHIDIKRDLAKVALIERHHGTGTLQVGLVNGFGFTEPCAVASTVAHDSHHMLVVGTDEQDMALATNKLAEFNGGQIVVRKGQVIGQVELNIAGLLSSERVEKVAEKVATIITGFKTCGCTLNNPNMQLSLLALVVIPELRISDKGLVDVTRFEFLPVVQGVVD